MSLKDWKKVKHPFGKRAIVWNNKKFNRDVVVDIVPKEAVRNERFPFTVLVANVDNNLRYTHLISKDFQTKTKALKFAKNYMRTH